MASVIFECDGCGKQAEGEWFGTPPSAHKPCFWYQRSDAGGVQVACSRECIEKVAARTGKTAIVNPM